MCDRSATTVRYLARRRTQRRLASQSGAEPLGNGTRRSGRRTVTRSKRLRAMTGSSRRHTDSTSGNSGTVSAQDDYDAELATTSSQPESTCRRDMIAVLFGCPRTSSPICRSCMKTRKLATIFRPDALEAPRTISLERRSLPASA
jgi:hypothetical protein